MDLKNGYNIIRIIAEDEWKTSFGTKQRLYKYIVMPFSLTDAPASFQKMMYTIFNNMGEYIWYLDNILIYDADTEAEHQAVVEKMLQ